MATLAALCAVALSASPAMAEGVSVEYAATKPVENSYHLDARIKFDPGEEVADALAHGVELHIDVFVRIKRERKWLWDPVVAETYLSHTLQHHPLSQDYVVTDLGRGIRQQFPTIGAALKYIGEITNLPVVSADALADGTGYSGFIRARLNIEALPAPLQPVAFVSEKWRMQSPWYEWVVR